jgi:hypothetical protein
MRAARRRFMAMLRPMVIPVLAVAAVPLTVRAGPLVLEETARISSPEPGFSLAGSVAIDGDFLVVTGARPQPEPDDHLFDLSAYLFQRNAAGTWTFVRKLVEHPQDSMIPYNAHVALRQGVAAVSLERLFVFERTAAGWVDAPSPTGALFGTDIEIDAGTILSSSGDCGWDALPFRKSSSGAWTAFGHIQGRPKGCDDEFQGGDVDISGNRAIVFNDADATSSIPEARLYEVGAAPPWHHVATLTTPPGADTRLPPLFGPYVALRNNTALVSGSLFSGTYVFERNTAGNWNVSSTLQVPDSLGGASYVYSLELRDGFAGQAQVSLEHGALYAINLFQRQSDGRFKYVAKLVASQVDGPDSVLPAFDISGRRIAVAGNSYAYVYELPADLTQPAVRQEDFQLGGASRWTPLAGSSFAVASSGTRRVYRQSATGGNATSLLNDTDWRNQSIEADITPTAFDGSDRWFGLAVRYADAANYYYVTVRSSNVIQLKKIVNGVFQTLESQPLPVALNRSYRVRLEAVGTFINVHVNGLRVLHASDDSLDQGQAGVMMFRTRADYDNVMVTPNPYLRLFQTDFFGAAPSDIFPWTAPAGSWIHTSDGTPTRVFTQTQAAGGARAFTGVDAEDQIVQVRARADSFGPGTDRWFGLMARYVDDSNYYYVTVRSSNTVSLRKLVNGAIHVIAEAPMTVSRGTWYTLKLEAVGNSLRAYVNGRLMVQGTDNSHAAGKYGLAMYKTAASYDDVLVYQP